MSILLFIGNKKPHQEVADLIGYLGFKLEQPKSIGCNQIDMPKLNTIYRIKKLFLYKLFTIL